MEELRNIKRIQTPRNGIQFIVYPEVQEELKPFVFFDAGKFARDDGGLIIHAHPHSGIGIITYFHGTDLHHSDSGDNNGIIYDGGAQWILAGGGVWHEEAYRRKHNAPDGPWEGAIHQMWIQLPPEFEESEVVYQNLQKGDVPFLGNTRVLIGDYNGIKGKISPPLKMTYLDVALSTNEVWEYETPQGQTNGFLFPREGELQIEGATIPNQRMGILDKNEGLIRVTTASPQARFMVALAEPSEHRVVSTGSSIHTNEAALARSLRRIKELRLPV